MDSVNFGRSVLNPYLGMWATSSINYTEVCRIFLHRLHNFETQVPVPCLQAICVEPSQTTSDYSIFQGSAGYLYLYIKLYSFFKSASAANIERLRSAFQRGDQKFYQTIDPKTYLKKAEAQYHTLLGMLSSKKESSRNPMISFMFSRLAVFYCGALLGKHIGDTNIIANCLKEVMKYHELVLERQGKWETEILYGLAGYLYMLIHLNREFQKTLQSFKRQIEETVEMLIDSGIKDFVNITGQAVRLDKPLPPNFRLVYLFHKKEYLGGAHGLAGVVNVLLMCVEEQSLSAQLKIKIQSLVIPSLRFLLSQKVNGNIPPSTGSKQSHLVQFCHGAPGVVVPLLRAQALFGDSKEVQQLNLPGTACDLLQHIWTHGVIKKGFYGLCHGISGNSYPFISPLLHKIIPGRGEEFYKKACLLWLLQQDAKTMDVIKNFEFEDRFKVGISDYPFSLMLGTAGDLVFCTDLLQGHGCLPGFDLV